MGFRPADFIPDRTGRVLLPMIVLDQMMVAAQTAREYEVYGIDRGHLPHRNPPAVLGIDQTRPAGLGVHRFDHDPFAVDQLEEREMTALWQLWVVSNNRIAADQHGLAAKA